MKLNRKGYLTVEVILASAAAVAIAFFLMEITIKLVNVTDDAYIDTELLTDKALVIENIKQLIEDDIKLVNESGTAYGGGIDEINCSNNECHIKYCYQYDRYLSIENNNIVYKQKSESKPLYEKNLNKSLSNFKITSSVSNNDSVNDGYILFKITADNKFSKENFEVNIIVNNKKDC